jgi:hypothetical protein
MKSKQNRNGIEDGCDLQFNVSEACCVEMDQSDDVVPSKLSHCGEYQFVARHYQASAFDDAFTDSIRKK